MAVKIELRLLSFFKKKKLFFSFSTVILGVLRVSDYKYVTMRGCIFILKKILL